MNQIFNITRFSNLATYYFKVNRKRFLLLLGGAFAFLYLLSLVILTSNNHWGNEDWDGLFLGFGIAGMIFYTGLSFPVLRKKESAYHYLMLPSSTFEKYVFEILHRFVLYLLVFPIVFFLASHIAAFSANVISKYSFQGYDLTNALSIIPPEGINAIISLVLLNSIIVFAGTTAFRKFPLVKTIAFMAALSMLVIGYFFVMIKIFGLEGGLAYVSKNLINTEELGRLILYLSAIVSSLVALAYGFFKLKEKEIA